MSPVDFVNVFKTRDGSSRGELRISRRNGRWTGWHTFPGATVAELVIYVTDKDITEMGRDPDDFAADLAAYRGGSINAPL